MRRALLVFLALGLVLVALPPLWYAVFPSPVAELPPAGRRVEVSPGLGVHLLESGAGPPLLLVHGQPGSAYDWQELTAELVRRGFRVIAYDRVGYGRSDPRAPGHVSLETNARELLGLLAALELRGVTLVGYSYGGGVAMAALRRDASRAARLVLLGSVGPGIEARATLPEPVMEFLAGPALSWIERVPPLARRLRAACAFRS